MNVTYFCFQNIESIPDELKQLYKTVWEVSQKTVIKMAADRGAFIDQSQSLNIHIAEPNYGKLSSMHFYAWKMVRPACGSKFKAAFIFLCQKEIGLQECVTTEQEATLS